MENNATLKHLTVTLCEENGDTIIAFDVNNQIATVIPERGDVVVVEGIHREVLRKKFMYLKNTQAVVVMITLKDVE